MALNSRYARVAVETLYEKETIARSERRVENLVFAYGAGLKGGWFGKEGEGVDKGGRG